MPSIWVVPGEKDIFGRTVPLSSQAAAGDQQSIPAAFSEASIMGLQRDGLIDEEGHRILRAIAAKPDRVQVYDRSQPTLLLRNTALSTTVTLPPLDAVSRSEIAFGVQKVSD